MVVDEQIKIIASSKTIFKLKSIGILAKMGEEVIIPIDKLWKNSNFKVNVKCDICGFERSLQYSLYNKNIKKYNIYCCSNKCSHFKNKLTCKEKYGHENYNNTEKAKTTILERYGVDNVFKSDIIREKIAKTNIERYGVDNVFKSDIIREKITNTNIEKYGVDNVFKSVYIKEKVKKTNLKRYGCEDSRSSDFVKNKRKLTNLEKYGFESYSTTDEYSAKVRETSLKKYGVDSPNKSDEIKEKKKKSMLMKYGYISNSMTEESKNKLKTTNLERYGVEFPMQVLEFFEKQQISSKKIKYYNERLYYQSSYEKHFLDYMNSIGVLDLISRGFHVEYDFEGIKRSHFPDFYIDKYNLIIEIKSSYYYNKYIDKNISKMNECVKLGYNYLFIINKNYTKLNEIIKTLI
jgi:hypothetical protein